MNYDHFLYYVQHDALLFGDHLYCYTFLMYYHVYYIYDTHDIYYIYDNSLVLFYDEYF